MDQAIKQTNGKPKLRYVPNEAATHGIAKVREWAIDIAKKYEDPKSIYTAVNEDPMSMLEASIRHLQKCIDFGSVDINDSESGLPHLYHAQTNLAFLATTIRGE